MGTKHMPPYAIKKQRELATSFSIGVAGAVLLLSKEANAALLGYPSNRRQSLEKEGIARDLIKKWGVSQENRKKSNCSRPKQPPKNCMKNPYIPARKACEDLEGRKLPFLFPLHFKASLLQNKGLGSSVKMVLGLTKPAA